jgi:hypothetical protein
MNRGNTKEFGGAITEKARTETNERSSKGFGSMMARFTLVKNSELAGDAEVIAAGIKPKGDDGLFPYPTVTLNRDRTPVPESFFPIRRINGRFCSETRMTHITKDTCNWQWVIADLFGYGRRMR